MLNIENCFLDCINSPVRQIKARVELYNGSTLLDTFRYTDRLISFTVERTGDSGKFFGFGVCHKVNIKLIDKNAELNITTANTFDIAYGTGCDYVYPYPLFKVSEVRRDENTNELSITAYDALYNAASYSVSELGLPNAYTIGLCATACATLLGLPVNLAADGFEAEYPTGANFDGAETVREALNAIAEATQTIYFINHNQELTFKRLDVSGAAVYDITKERYITLDSSTNRRLVSICHATELGDNVEASLTVSGTTQYVRDNPFWELREDIAAIVETALERVGGLTINQFTCQWRGNYLLEIGDKISLTTKDGESVYSYLLDDTTTYNGGFSQKTQWKYTENESETESNPSTLGEALKQTFARVDKVNKEIAIVASEAETNKNNITSLQLNTTSLTATVSQMEQNTNELTADVETLTNKVEAAMDADGIRLIIQEELANGVDKVYTSTGFSFDADGLRISKTGTEMETLLDEDGLTVYRDNTEVLTADNTGVNGINMTVRQYLIVGGSRFESYGGRTGCFWVG